MPVKADRIVFNGTVWLRGSEEVHGGLADHPGLGSGLGVRQADQTRVQIYITPPQALAVTAPAAGLVAQDLQFFGVQGASLALLRVPLDVCLVGFEAGRHQLRAVGIPEDRRQARERPVGLDRR